MGIVPIPLILDVEIDQSAIAATEKINHEHDHHAHEHHHSAHLENDGFISISFQSDRAFDLDKFQNFLDKKLSIDVFRAKGILRFASIDKRYVFQLSGKRYELKNDDRDKPVNNQLVIIGRNLHREEILAQLTDCLI